MSTNNDAEDSRMSSPSSSEDTTTTPLAQITSPSILSPPDSQHREPNSSSARTMPGSASIANSNGKRPIQTISNGNDDMDELAAMANGKARQDMPVKTHSQTGYQWQRAEDEPGYQWMNKKAMDEFSRASDILQHKDSMIKGKYGDPFEIVEKERAILASMK